MTDEELRRLKRPELLELLVAQEKETAALREKLAKAEQALADRRIQLEEAGDIAQAALQLNGVFEAAQAAAAQYLDTIQGKGEETERRCAQLEESCRARAEKVESEAAARAAALEAETAAKCQALEEETKARCDQMVAQAERETREFWDIVSRRLEEFYAEHAALRELLSVEQLTGAAHG